MGSLPETNTNEQPLPLAPVVEQWEFTQPSLQAFQAYQRPILNTFARVNGLIHDYQRQVDYLRKGVFSEEVNREAMCQARAAQAANDLAQLIADSEPLEGSMKEQVNNLLLYFQQQAQQRSN